MRGVVSVVIAAGTAALIYAAIAVTARLVRDRGRPKGPGGIAIIGVALAAKAFALVFVTTWLRHNSHIEFQLFFATFTLCYLIGAGLLALTLVRDPA